MAIDIHPTAVVHRTAVLGENVRIGPYAVVGEEVVIGEGTWLGPHAVVEAHTRVGRDCQIFSGAVVGAVPQDLKFGGEESYTVIGDRNVIRECVTINRATGYGEETRIGDDNLLMAYVHVAHNCVLGSNLVLANGVTLAGHVEVEDGATIGGLSGIHQFVRIGAMAMVGGMTKITQDVLPYMLVDGNPPKMRGPNAIGLRRKGMDSEARLAVKRAYKTIYRSQMTVGRALAELEGFQVPVIEHIVRFAKGSERGITGIAAREDSDA